MRVQGADEGPAHDGPGGPMRARLLRVQVAHEGPAKEDPGGDRYGSNLGISPLPYIYMAESHWFGYHVF